MIASRSCCFRDGRREPSNHLRGWSLLEFILDRKNIFRNRISWVSSVCLLSYNYDSESSSLHLSRISNDLTITDQQDALSAPHHDSWARAVTQDLALLYLAQCSTLSISWSRTIMAQANSFCAALGILVVTLSWCIALAESGRNVRKVSRYDHDDSSFDEWILQVGTSRLIQLELYERLSIEMTSAHCHVLKQWSSVLWLLHFHEYGSSLYLFMSAFFQLGVIFLAILTHSLFASYLLRLLLI